MIVMKRVGSDSDLIGLPIRVTVGKLAKVLSKLKATGILLKLMPIT